MGMYTQLHFGTTLRHDVPPTVIETLKFMVGDRDEEPRPLPDHPLFKTDRWRFMMRCDSYYFDYKTTHFLTFDEIGNQWYFNVTTNLKNYGDEIEAFIDWIMPYCDKLPGQFLGYSRYEETEDPTILRMAGSAWMETDPEGMYYDKLEVDRLLQAQQAQIARLTQERDDLRRRLEAR